MVVAKFRKLKSLASWRFYSTVGESKKIIDGKTFEIDSYTNITENVLSRLDRKLYKVKYHPLCLLKERIIRFFYSRFRNSRGNPLFSVYDDLNPIVTTQQNFDSLLIPESHPSRKKTDSYYVNKEWMLRAHMTAHQSDLIKFGLNNFLMVGEVFRRDHVDSCHFDIFHQIDGVRLLTPGEVFSGENEIKPKEGRRTSETQENYTKEASGIVEKELKKTLEDLSKDLFGNEIKFKWVDAYFPFTHPSWELEVLHEGNWIEMLGCGIVEHEILKRAGCENRIGWAFGCGLERLAMTYYSIPDIRLFWSKDPGFLHQFEGKSCTERFPFKAISKFPPCPFDLSFWIGESFEEQDFFSLVKEHCSDIVEQVQLIDVFKHPKTGKESRCYRLVYRSMEKTLTKEEINEIHNGLVARLVSEFKVTVR